MVSNLRFADDTTLVSSSKEELIDLLKRIKETSKTRNLLLSIQKTKIMVLDNNRPENDPFIVDDERIEEVESFVYLGSLINIKGSTTQELRRRLAIGREAVQKLTTIWRAEVLPSRCRLECCRPLSSLRHYTAVKHGHWRPLTKGVLTRLRCAATGDCCEFHGCTNERVLERIGFGLVLRKASIRRKFLLFVHIMRRSGSLEKVLIQGKVEGKRRRGRPTTPWFQTIKDATGVSLAAAAELALNRQGWRDIIAALGATWRKTKA